MSEQPVTAIGGLASPRGFGWIGHLIPWAIALVFYYFAGGYLSLGTGALIMILFAMSLDIALGYAGIVTLGQAAFFGFGAYTAGIFAIHVNNDPILGLLVATALTAVFGLVTGAVILHTQGVTLLMLTLAIVTLLYEAANRAIWSGGRRSRASRVRTSAGAVVAVLRGAQDPRPSTASGDRMECLADDDRHGPARRKHTHAHADGLGSIPVRHSRDSNALREHTGRTEAHERPR